MPVWGGLPARSLCSGQNVLKSTLRNTPDGLPDSADVALKIQKQCAELLSCLQRDARCVKAGRYIPMAESSNQLNLFLEGENETVIRLMAQVAEIATTLKGIRGIPEVV